jgi:hypothetical protein
MLLAAASTDGRPAGQPWRVSKGTHRAKSTTEHVPRVTIEPPDERSRTVKGAEAVNDEIGKRLQIELWKRFCVLQTSAAFG